MRRGCTKASQYDLSDSSHKPALRLAWALFPTPLEIPISSFDRLLEHVSHISTFTTCAVNTAIEVTFVTVCRKRQLRSPPSQAILIPEAEIPPGMESNLETRLKAGVQRPPAPYRGYCRLSLGVRDGGTHGLSSYFDDASVHWSPLS